MAFIPRSASAFVRSLFPFARQEEHLEITKKELYLNAVYKIIIWEDPFLSGITLGMLHVLLWLIVQLELRFYSIVFLTILLLVLLDFCLEQQTLGADCTNKNLHLIADLIMHTFLTLKSLRKEEPSTFCIVMCGLLFGLLAIGQSINGYMFAYLLLLGIFVGPVIISKLPEEYVSSIKEAVNMYRNEQGLAESELIPYISDKDLFANEDTDSLVNSNDSLSNSLISGISSMPSYLDAESSMDGLKEEDLLPKKSAIDFSSGESSDSDYDPKNITFESHHFTRDSSSEEELYFAKDLSFPEDSQDSLDFSRKLPTQKNVTPASGTGIMNNLTTLGTNFISNVLKTVDTSKRSDSSDSDFEIINTEEADDRL